MRRHGHVFGEWSKACALGAWVGRRAMMIGQLQTIALAGVFTFGLSGIAVAAPVTGRNPSQPGNVHAIAAVTDADDDVTNCSRIRRRLWVDGQGWIVRRITTCH